MDHIMDHYFVILAWLFELVIYFLKDFIILYYIVQLL
jgi:hypothetical protein